MSAERENYESTLLDIVLNTEGAISYQDIITMPVDSIQLLIKRLNNKREEQNKAIRSSR